MALGILVTLLQEFPVMCLLCESSKADNSSVSLLHEIRIVRHSDHNWGFNQTSADPNLLIQRLCVFFFPNVAFYGGLSDLLFQVFESYILRIES